MPDMLVSPQVPTKPQKHIKMIRAFQHLVQTGFQEASPRGPPKSESDMLFTTFAATHRSVQGRTLICGVATPISFYNTLERCHQGSIVIYMVWLYGVMTPISFYNTLERYHQRSAVICRTYLCGVATPIGFCNVILMFLVEKPLKNLPNSSKLNPKV